MPSKGLLWFRNDLRIEDNPALAAALRACDQVDAIYIEETDDGLRPVGAATRVWLRESLRALNENLAVLGISLSVKRGSSARLIPELAIQKAYTHVFWNRRYAPTERKLDAGIKARLRNVGVVTKSFNASLLVEPWDFETKTGKPFSVFTPFWKALREKHIEAPVARSNAATAIETGPLELEPHPEWAHSILESWTIGEKAAKAQLTDFLDDLLAHYAKGRDYPGQSVTSRLSPYLRCGEIGPRQIWQATRHLIDSRPDIAAAGEKFLSELAWREFSYHLLYHRDDIAKIPMQERFAAIEWRKDPVALHRWQKGQTGIPIVDAGMRQLWVTGWMHNRVRMLVGSLLTKNLLMDWRQGERWFWDTLVDADPANNPASWQWVAGCGADAAPYFRVFNPVTQGEKFDKDGQYVTKWVPELAHLPSKYVHRPCDAPQDVLIKAGVEIGKTYPQPIVDLVASRQRAIAALGRKDVG